MADMTNYKCYLQGYLHGNSLFTPETTVTTNMPNMVAYAQGVTDQASGTIRSADTLDAMLLTLLGSSSSVPPPVDLAPLRAAREAYRADETQLSGLLACVDALLA